MIEDSPASSPLNVAPESLTTVLDVVYVHRKTSDGGDIYFTRYGLLYSELLALENWYEKKWFRAHAERLQGTSAVFRVPTKEIDGTQLSLVVKNCRVGEDVPLQTKTLLEFINAEFNSPWEEFALVMEMREGRYGPAQLNIDTQLPLAIYVPPEKMQLWQSGRSYCKINQINARHPGIDLDILRQYKMIYRWIDGMNIVEAFESVGVQADELEKHLQRITGKVTDDMQQKGFAVADMKPDHVILPEEQLAGLAGLDRESAAAQAELLDAIVDQGSYSVIDYELLLRTPAHEKKVKHARRHSYLDEMRDRFTDAPLPNHLRAVEIFDVPYVAGFAESTGGQLYVVGKHPKLFDYFLPERWRKTPSWRLSERSEIHYTVTKDNVHIVWKTSRVGEVPVDYSLADAERIAVQGFNSPFEEAAIAQFLSENGVPAVYVRAVYMTGSMKLEQPADLRRFNSHKSILGPDGLPVLRSEHDYITIRGYFNGPDEWVAQQEGLLCRPIDLAKACKVSWISDTDYRRIFGAVQQKLKNIGFDGSLLKGNDMLLAIAPNGVLLKDKEGMPEARICNFELIHRL